MQDIEIQLSVLKELQKFLVQFCEDIRVKSVEFNHKVKQLREAVVAIQIAEYYEVNYGDQNIQHLQTLITNITDNDLPYINTKISQFEQMLTGGNNMVYQRYSGTPVYRIENNMIYEKYSGTPIHRMD